ncbi:MAG: universal stress protein [Proteobacteria bacterium]|nr:universal stress protein [Pseudomonadota bacterium]
MYKNILLTVDLTEESSWKKALPTAVETCQCAGATLHVLSVVPDFGMTVVAQFFPEDYENKTVEEARKELEKLCAGGVPDGVTVKPIVAYGTIYEQIISVAERIEADLIVMAAHRPALEDYLLGPNAARVVRHSNCSVLVVRD